MARKKPKDATPPEKTSLKPPSDEARKSLDLAGQNIERRRANIAMSPAIKSLATATLFNDSLGGKCDDLSECLDVLAECIDRAKTGNMAGADVMLVSQAHAMDSAFNYLLRLAIKNTQAGYIQAANMYFALAARFQSQTRCTWETLSKIHNPPAPNFIRQANIANGPQQVNNNGSRTEARGDQPNELLGEVHEPRMDAGTPAAASGSDPAMEAVGAIDGTEDA